MDKGLTVWKNDGDSILLDVDNIFWGIIKDIKNHKDFIIPSDLLNLYGRVKSKLDEGIHNFRFSQELTAIYIDPTDRCNATCPYCYIPLKIRQNGRSLSKFELNFILEKIRQYFENKKRKAVVVFHASEPLLVKDIIFEAITKYSGYFKFGLQTNAILLEKEDIKFLMRYRIGVGISLDSFSSSINDRLRPSRQGENNFSRIIKAIEWFDGYEGLNIITTVTKLNVKDLPALVRFLHTRKVPCVLLNPVRLTQVSARSLKPDGKTLTKYFIEAVDTAIKLSRNTRHKIIVGNFTNIILGIVAPQARKLMCDISPCGGGRCFLTITASGDMIPCGEFIGLKGFAGGNIFKTSIEKAMQSRGFRRIRSRIVEEIHKCRTCIFRNICGAPCPAELYSLGEMTQPSVFCEFYKEIIKYAFRIISEKKEEHCFRADSLSNLEYEYIF